MSIPIIPVSGKTESLVSGALICNSDVPAIAEGTECDFMSKAKEVFGATEKNDIIAMVDVDSFADKGMNTDVVKGIRMKKRAILLITYIHDVDDVFDALCGGSDYIGIPLHTVNGMDVLEEIIQVSEDSFPVAFVKNGLEISSRKTAQQLFEEVCDKGYNDLLVFNTASASLSFYSEP